MPLLSLRTNIPLPPPQRLPLLRQLSALTAELLGKSEQFVMIHLEPESDLLFAGNDAPCAYLEFKSLGLPETDTEALSSELCQRLEDLLGIDQNRVYIEFTPAERHLWGWNGRTFAR